MVLRVVGWDQYEGTQDRRLVRLRRITIPTDMGGGRFKRLMRHHPEHFGPFILMLEVAATCPVRGVLVTHNRPYDAVELSDVTLAPKEMFEQAIPYLVSELGWLEQHETIEEAVRARVAEAKGTEKQDNFASNAAESIYELYPRKAGYRVALAAIDNAIARLATEKGITRDQAVETLKEATGAYADAVKTTWTEADLQFVPHPSTWFNQDRFRDDRTRWKRGAQKGDAQCPEATVDPDTLK